MSALHAVHAPIPRTIPRSHGPHMTADQVARAQVRATLREFLRSTPREEPDATIDVRLPDGSVRRISRYALTSRIDGLRPRMRKIVRLGIEERWPRQRVCAYLRGICTKTYERDEQEALEILLADA